MEEEVLITEKEEEILPEISGQEANSVLETIVKEENDGRVEQNLENIHIKQGTQNNHFQPSVNPLLATLHTSFYFAILYPKTI